MIYLYDIWVNWFANEEDGCNVCHYHEWRKDDDIKLLDTTPLIYVTESLFSHVENSLMHLPEALLERIYNKSQYRKGQKVLKIDYAAVITDGRGVLAFDTKGYEFPIEKSRLIPRQESYVFRMIEGESPESFGFNEDIIPYSSDMIGLTRRERNLKQILLQSIERVGDNKDLDELKYWLTELTPNSYEDVKKMNYKSTWNSLMNEVKNGWSEEHERICGQMANKYLDLQLYFHTEQGEYTSKI